MLASVVPGPLSLVVEGPIGPFVTAGMPSCMAVVLTGSSLVVAILDELIVAVTTMDVSALIGARPVSEVIVVDSSAVPTVVDVLVVA